jgi:hypothetical protein
MSNNKQTSVEQLFHKLWDTPKDKFTWYAMLKEHIAMEKEQIKIAYYNGTTDEIKTKDELLLDAEHYYNETYGRNK